MFKKFLLLNLFLSFSISTINSVGCESIISIPSKKFQGKLHEINIFFQKQENKIKLYNFNYLTFINQSWEHNNFDSYIFSTKAENVIISKKSNFVKLLSDIYKPFDYGDEWDFTGLSFVVENIFINTIELNNNLDQLNISSEVALTIYKGWKIQGKILASLTECENIEKKLAFQFINKIINSLFLNISISYQTDKEGNGFYKVQNIENIFQEKNFQEKIKINIFNKLALNLDDINFKFDKQNKWFEIFNVRYQ